MAKTKRKCQHCGGEMMPLPQLSKRGEEVWVCAEPGSGGKSKAPCDGPTFAIALKNG